ncbi:unnamed protein product [Rotaria sp. Silwood1]|nr:unnamed protein product [Rotaria sp. Silwood1]CAF1655860.1 unnamed protein product [Rotaria sp. Silwood1]
MPTATFSTVADREKLYRNCVPREKPASYPLDPNHTHFILLDDKCGPNDEIWRRYGYPVRADLTIQLRAEVEQEARCSSHYRHNYKIPIIQILIEGGPSSLLTVVEAVMHETPVVVIDGTGRAANFIAKAYKALYDNQTTYFSPANNNANLERVIKEDGKDIITGSNEKRFRDMIRSEKGFFLINTFLLCPDDPEFKLSDAILQALFRAASMPKHEISDAHVQKLKLAMAWNKFDLVVSDMLIENVKTQWTDVQLDSALTDAIQHGSVQFVELLIEQGASFDRLRRLINIKDLYKKKTGLPLSKKEITVDDNNKQKMYYKQYLNTEALQTIDFFQGKKALHSNNVDIYGTIENPLKRTTKLNGLVVFNGDDVIRQNGYVKQVSIVFSNSHNPSVTTGTSNHVVLYIISPTSDTDCFQVVDVLKTDVRDYQYDNNKLTIHMYNSAVYVEQGQYLAIGFDKNSRSPSYLDGLSSCYTLDIDAVNRVYMNKTSIKFQWSRERVAIRIQIILTSGRIILVHNK